MSKYLKQSIWVVTFVFLAVFLQTLSIGTSPEIADAQAGQVTLTPPVSPNPATPGSTITVTGNNFTPGMYAYYGSYEFYFTYISSTEMTYVLPSNIPPQSGNLNFEIDGGSYYRSIPLEIVSGAPVTPPVTPPAQTSSSACSEEGELCGFAWSENVGWVSFNSKDCDLDDNGQYGDAGAPSGCPASGTVTNYKVSIIDPVGPGLTKKYLDGYAWSDTIGYIKFGRINPLANPSDTFPVSSGSTADNVYIDSSGVFHGFARACSVYLTGCSGNLKPSSERGGWDGWIGFDDVYNEDGTINGMAWGADVIGWLNMFGVTTYNNFAPGVSIKVNNSSNVTQAYNTGTPLNIEAIASDVDGSVSNIVFYKKYNTDATSTVATTTTTTAVINSPANGVYNLVAVATDNLGLEKTSSSIEVTIESPTQCNNGTDDDGDGYVDYHGGVPGVNNNLQDSDGYPLYWYDPGCSNDADTTENSNSPKACSNRRDDDGNSDKDFNDPDCNPGGVWDPSLDSEGITNKVSQKLLVRKGLNQTTFTEDNKRFIADAEKDVNTTFKYDIDGFGSTTTCQFVIKKEPGNYWSNTIIKSPNELPYVGYVNYTETINDPINNPFKTKEFTIQCSTEVGATGSDSVQIIGTDQTEI